MTIRARGISEKVRYAYNPLPSGSVDKFLAAAGYSDLERGATVDAFLHTWKYGMGLQVESVDLAPGDFIPLRESEGREFIRSTNTEELGLCVVEHADAEHPATKKAAIDALRKAARFYADAGRKALVSFRKRHSYTEQDMADMRQSFSAYYVNIAKEQAINAKLEKLTGKAGTAPTAKAKVA